ncbi:MAG: hypothetical protein ACE5HU_06655 [Acidobacteriota bacterium]
MQISDLEKMTVVKLREEAKKFDDLKGVSGMSKEKLIDILCNKLGLTRRTKLRKGIGRRALKTKISELKRETAKILAEGDPKKARIHRRRLKAARHRLRKVVFQATREAKRKAAAAPSAAAPPEESTAQTPPAAS